MRAFHTAAGGRSSPSTLEKTDPGRYVDSTTVPYIVFPGAFNQQKGTGTLGDFGIVRNLRTSAITVAIVADIGPLHAPLGEVSIRLAAQRGGSQVTPRNGHGMPKGPFLYVMFPKSHATPKWPVTDEAMHRFVEPRL